MIDHAVQLYGDLIYDYCATILWSQSNAQVAFRSVVRQIKKTKKAQGYKDHERAWILRIASDKLKSMYRRHARRLTPSEQIMLDASMDAEARLKQFDSYFHRLAIEDQMILALRDKYGLPYAEIATALGLPEGAIKVRRQQALRTLEDWLWDVAPLLQNQATIPGEITPS